MPVIELHVIEGYSDADKTRLCAALTDAVRMVVPVDPDAVTVMINERRVHEYMRGRTHRTPAAASQDPTDIIRAYLAAMEARDLDAARALLAPGFSMTFPGTAPMAALEDLIAWSKPRYQYVAKTYDGFDAMLGQGGAAIVYCRGTLAGKWPDGTAFDGIRFIDRFELVAGRITRQDVWNDIAETKAGQ